MSIDITDPGHGNSTAAWTAVTIMVVGFVIGTIAFFFVVEWLVWASAGIVVVGLIVGWILVRAGYGIRGAKSAQRVHQ
jgi:hypothetical protein